MGMCRQQEAPSSLLMFVCRCFLLFVFLLAALSERIKMYGCRPKQTIFSAPLAEVLGKSPPEWEQNVRDRPPWGSVTVENFSQILSAISQKMRPKQQTNNSKHDMPHYHGDITITGGVFETQRKCKWRFHCALLSSSSTIIVMCFWCIWIFEQINVCLGVSVSVYVYCVSRKKISPIYNVH